VDLFAQTISCGNSGNPEEEQEVTNVETQQVRT
jgi:hypothetical protein